MREKKLYLLLSVVRSNGNIRRLTRENITYKDIADLTNYAIEHNLVEYDENDVIHLTGKGEEKLNELEISYKERNKDKWIEPEKKSKITKISKNFIYLPYQDELHF